MTPSLGRFLVRLVACAALGSAALSPLAAQERVPVLLDATVSDDDTVGRVLAFELKEGVRGTRSFRLVDDPKAWPYLRVAIVTLKTSEVSSALAVTYVYDDPVMPLEGAFIHSAIHTCGRERTTACARSILASIDEAASRLRRADATLYRKLVSAAAPGSSGAPAGAPPARTPAGTMQSIGLGAGNGQ